MGGGGGGGGGLHGERAGQDGKCGILAEGAAGAARPGRDRGIRRRVEKAPDRPRRSAGRLRGDPCWAIVSSVAPRNPAIDGGKEGRAVDRQLLPRVRIAGMILVYRYRVKSLNGLLNK
ncbi:Mobile element protein [Burkholderia cenocepacia KC-01]|nr:Mobile element protein [Burkholderia cenocepacia KC-01]